MAQATPKGIAKSAVMNVKMIVPIIGVKIPPLVIPSDGVENKKSQDNNGAALEAISQITTRRKKQTSRVLNNKVPHSTTEVNRWDLRRMIFAKTIDKILS